MKHYMGIGGEMLHDSGVTIIDEQGNIKFASMYERYSGKKHDAMPAFEWLKECSEKWPNTTVYNNDDWDIRFKFRPMLEDMSRKKFLANHGIDSTLAIETWSMASTTDPTPQRHSPPDQKTSTKKIVSC